MAHTMFMMGPAELIVFLLFGGGAGLPLGMPPAQEDPLLARAAPAECLFYLCWQGVAEPDAASANHTERLLAEPEVRRFLSELDKRIVASMRREAGDDPQAGPIIDAAHQVVMAVLTSPTAAFISDVQVGRGEPEVRGGVVVNLGDRAAGVQRALATIQAAATGGQMPPARDGWNTLPLPDGPTLSWGMKDHILVVGLGDGQCDKIAARLANAPPQWLVTMRQQVSVERPANAVYVNVKGIVDKAARAMGGEGPMFLTVLGLDKVGGVASVTGLEGKDCVTRTLLGIDGEPSGVLSLLAARPLSAADLPPIPDDASIAAAARFDLDKAYNTFLEVAGRLQPFAREEIVSGMGMLEEQLGFSIANDVFKSLGDVWCVYNSPASGGLVVTGMTAVVDLKDRDRLVRANSKLVLATMAAGAADSLSGHGRSRQPRILQFEHAGQTIFFLSVPDDDMPLAPAWCITDTHLIVAPYPQNVKAFLTPAAAGQPGTPGTLQAKPEFASLLSERPPLGVFYADTPELFKLVYPLVNIFATVMCGELQSEGIDVDVSLLPSAAAIVPHLRASTSKVLRTDAGVMLESRRTLPVGGGSSMVLPMFFLGFSARAVHVDVGDLPTPRNRSMNRMKQIGLAMHNFHDSFKGFPPTAAPRKPGQPPVSWRVLVLPYIEEAVLYDQYKFDEPWDSENNKRILAQMPEAYKAPGSKVADRGMTNYLVVVGDEYAFAPDKRRRMAEFRDGTSNTIMVVEVADEKAVPWTKPADFTPDAKNPEAGLVGMRHGGFLAGLTDGSVRFIQAGLDAQVLHALFTRAGGEVIDRDVLGGRRTRSGRSMAVPVAPAAEEPAVQEAVEEAVPVER